MDIYADEVQNPFQHQMQINQIEQIKLLKLSHEALMNLLSLAEKYAKHRSTYIKSEFVWQIYYFQKIMKSYTKRYGQYTFLDNYQKKNILERTYYYLKQVRNEDKFLYGAMIDLLHEKELLIDFDKLFDLLDKENKTKIPRDFFPKNSLYKNESVSFGNKNYLKEDKRQIQYEDFE